MCWAPVANTILNLPKNVYNDSDDGRQRFLLELEFVQCLANPTYIHYLAQNRYFEDEAFIGYLKYLQYCQQLEYTKFIIWRNSENTPLLLLFALWKSSMIVNWLREKPRNPSILKMMIILIPFLSISITIRVWSLWN
ncbi:hypothetical protein M9H77_12948 [Catharanthus roseus]|uniref:Uncharacterized protein n=1 Tax=Catharanthus roseus TaxID=4058 RepID=A0ACC0BIZ5_CATRO|nr:hypothetical protein M9H77_12948 [Catharanthus roseus]